MFTATHHSAVPTHLGYCTVNLCYNVDPSKTDVAAAAPTCNALVYFNIGTDIQSYKPYSGRGPLVTKFVCDRPI